MVPNKTYSSPAPPPDLILGDTRRLLFWFCCSGAFQKFSSSIQAYISCDCTSDIVLDRLFCNLLPVTVKSGTVPTHTNTVLSLELFPPLSPRCFPFLLHPLLSDLFAYLFCYLSSQFLCLASEFCPCLSLSLISLLSPTQVFSHCLMGSTSQISGFGEFVS